MTDAQKAVVTRALDTWGARDQLDMFAGEAGEALVWVGRYAQGRFDAEAFGREVADLIVMCESMKQLVERAAGRAFVDDHVVAQIDRLGRKLDANTP